MNKSSTPRISFQVGVCVRLSDAVIRNPSMGFLVTISGYGQGTFKILSVAKGLSGSHEQLLEIDFPHPKRIRTWICGSLLEVA